MMTLNSKKELLKVTHPRYLKANKKKKTAILNEFIAATGYHRKYAIRVLKNGPQNRKINKRGSRRKIYRGEVVEILTQIWELMGRICSKRLKPFLPEIVEVLERCNELKMAPETKALLLQMSCSTIDRCLKPERFKSKKRGLSTTKPGTLLKHAIPIQTDTRWDETVPGFVEIDLVAHCGESVAGQYLNTLTVTDIATGWTECLGILHRSQEKVTEAIIDLRKRLPFPLRGIDSDNGSEFINRHFLRIVRMRKLLSHAVGHTEKMTRRMWNKRIGLLFDVLLAMIVMKRMRSWKSFRPFTVTGAFS